MMDITVTIPNTKTDNVIAALDATVPTFTPPTGTVTEIRNAVAAFYADKWKADQQLPDPLA